MSEYIFIQEKKMMLIKLFMKYKNNSKIWSEANDIKRSIP